MTKLFLHFYNTKKQIAPYVIPNANLKIGRQKMATNTIASNTNHNTIFHNFTLSFVVWSNCLNFMDNNKMKRVWKIGCTRYHFEENFIIRHDFTIKTFHCKEKHMTLPFNIFGKKQNRTDVANYYSVDYITLQWHQIVWTGFYVHRKKRTLDQAFCEDQIINLYKCKNNWSKYSKQLDLNIFKLLYIYQ